MDIDNINLCDATTEELKHLVTMISEEIVKRKQARKKRTIDNFEKAFEELLPFVDIFYEDNDELIYLNDFRKFKFE